MSDKSTSWVIKASVEADGATNELNKIVALLKQQNELTQQANLSARTGSIQQVTAIEAVTAALQKQNTTTTSGTNQQRTSLGLLKNEYDNLGKTINGITQILAGAFIVSEIKNYVQEVIKAKSAQDLFSVSLENMLKSKVLADNINAQLMAIAIKSPFEIEQIQQVTTKLVGMGVEVNKIIPYITMLGEISAVVGTSKLPLIAKAMLDVMNKGVLMKQELNQFAENGVPLYDLLAASMGKTRDEVVKLAEAHKITFKDVELALKTATSEGGRYYGQMAAQAGTLAGQVSNMQDKYTLAKAAIGDFFEDTLKGGISTMTSLIHETIGSQAAIARMVDVVKAAASAYVTYRLAVNTANSAKQAAAASTVALTAAEGGATVATFTFAGAMNALKAAFVTNPIGIFLTALGALMTAFYSYKALTAEVTDEQNQQSDAIRKSNKEFEIATLAVMQHAEGTDAYKIAVDNLMSRYPEYFAGIEKEGINNRVLKGVLMEVNESFQERIRLANLAYKADALTQKAIELDREQLEIITQLRKEYEGISKVNLNDESFLKAVRAQQSDLSKIGNAMREVLTLGLVKGDIYNASSIINEKKAIEKELIKIKDESEKEQTIITARSLDQQFQLLIKQLNNKDITQKEFNDKVAILKGDEVKTHGKGEDNKQAKGKQTTELALENQVKELKAQEQTFFVKQDLLNAEEKLDIERAKRQIKSKSEEAERILSIETEYDLKRQKLLESTIDYEMKDLKKIQEQADKEFKIRNTLAEDLVDITLYVNGLFLKEEEEKNKRLIELGKEVFDAQKDLHQATIKLGELDAEADAKIWQNKAIVVEKYYRDKVLGPALEAAKKLEAIAQNEYDHMLATFGAKDEMTLKALENLTKAKTAATDALREVGENGKKITELTIDDIIKYAQAAMSVVRMLADGFIESSRLAADSIENVLGMADNAIEANRAALDKQLEDVSLSYEDREKIIQQSLNRETEMMKRKSALLEIQQQLEDTAVKTENTMQMVNAGLNAVVSFAKGDFVGGLVGVAEFVTAAFNRSALNQIQDEMRVLRQKQRNAQDAISELEREMSARTRLHEETLRLIDESEAAFKKGKEAEIESAQDAFDKDKALLEQKRDAQVRLLNEQLDAINAFYDNEIARAREAFAIKQGLDEQAAADGKRLLEASDAFRNQTLDSWERREVKRLEDERDRNLARAQSDEDYQQIANHYAGEIANVHKMHEDAKLDKSLAVKLGMEELSAQLKDTTTANKKAETDAINALEDERQAKAEKVQNAILAENTKTTNAITTLETTLKDTITGLQDAITANATKATADRATENKNYTDFVAGNQAAIFEQQKQLAILSIRMEIAKLKAEKRKLFKNKSALNAAISEMEGLINEITGGGGEVADDWGGGSGGEGDGGGGDGSTGGGSGGEGGGKREGKFHGDTFLKRNGRQGYGLDTIPIMAHVGERIMQAYINAKLGPDVSNEELADGYLNYQKLIDKLPDLNLHVNAAGKLNMPVKTLAVPQHIEPRVNRMEVINLELQKEIRVLSKALDKIKILNVDIDGNSISISEQMNNQKIKYFDKQFNS